MTNQNINSAIKLNKTELKTIMKVLKDYPTETIFEIITQPGGGIGTVVLVKIDGEDMLHDVTDVSCW